ncbi:DNA-binding response regulator [Brevibacillus reuszeri]|uniref:DNA-binding response regulator n=1 Tax=Brevibacillus reuszeri TaxID=54915 RepID=A0A0K9YSE2_9BACL|nr:response regulator [Brevibacillus reuszeri]KNB71557.1 histidine kinase [Brevibacillus reuszeri]MED1855632.1 response regulator [Brevibacillus reuszeri]GED67218.1 DNA-binding response regulator [Brevibacillus reuszeri]
MFKVVIVEDEQPILDLMKYVIGQNPHYTIVGAFTSPLEALACLPDLCPHVAFLDVEMPRMNGLQLGQKINELCGETKIIFTTAHKQYALDAFGVHAVDYILKPVTPAAIERVTQRLMKQLPTMEGSVKSVSRASIACFGGFEIRNPEGLPVRWPTKKTEELLAFLLCYPERDMSKWHLMDLLWSEMDEERATHNLHNTMYRLKKLMKEQSLGMDIQKTSEGYMLLTLEQTYDVLAFQQFDASSLTEAQGLSKAEDLLTMYKGPLLDRKDYLWKTSLEEGFSKQYSLLVRSLLEHDLAALDYQRAEQRLDTCLSMYPLHEEFNVRLMDIYARSGQQQKISLHYAKFAKAYQLELGMEPPLEIQEWLRENT